MPRLLPAAYPTFSGDRIRLVVASSPSTRRSTTSGPESLSTTTIDNLGWSDWASAPTHRSVSSAWRWFNTMAVTNGAARSGTGQDAAAPGTTVEAPAFTVHRTPR